MKLYRFIEQVSNSAYVENTVFFKHLQGGAEFISTNQVRFRLWAPDATQVSLVFADDQQYEMRREAISGWFSLEISCIAGARYRYQITNKNGKHLLVPDPVSRAQVDSVHGDSIVVDPQAYQWRNTKWRGRPWHEMIIYELHAGVLGGFKGVRGMLASLASMGFTAIELMPIASFPGDRNWGYDGVLQYAPQYSYGSPDELKSLIDEAHTLGLSVFLDVVYNHFGPEGNYLYDYASPFFSKSKKTPWGDAIDFERQEVRNFFSENVLYWLEEYRFDGLRFDACHAIWDKTWLAEITQQVQKTIGQQRNVHLIAENDDTIHMQKNGFDAQWNDDAHHALHVLLTGESEGYYAPYAEKPAQILARSLTEGVIKPALMKLNERENTFQQSFPPDAFVLFLQNHDHIGNRPFGERLTTLAAEPGLRAASALLLLSPQIPMLFMGEEYGATQPFLYFVSHTDDALIKSVQEGRRTEFASFEKFSKTDFAVKIPDPQDTDTFFISTPRPTSADAVNRTALSWDRWITMLINLRHYHIIPRLKGSKAISAEAISAGAIKARWQMSDGATLVIAINLYAEDIKIALEDIADPHAKVIFDYQDAFDSLQKGALPGYGFIALLEWSYQS